MKKISIALACLFLISTNAFCSPPKEFSVIWSLLDSLHLLDWGSSYEIIETDDFSQMMTKLMNQNSKYKSAANMMEKYLNDNDEFISIVSKGIAIGALMLADANNKVIDKLRKMSNLDAQGFEDADYMVAETNAQKKQAWEMILLSAGWSLPIMMESPKDSENSTGKILFKFSDEDRRSLVKRIDKLFGEKLKRYKNFKELSKQGQETNPDDLTYIIAGVARIRENLTTETYEQAKAIEVDKN